MQGRPIYIQHLGQVNIKKIYDITTEERMLKFHVQEYERCIQYIMPACSKVAGRHIEQTFAILDVKGIVLLKHGRRRVVPLQVTQCGYIGQALPMVVLSVRIKQHLPRHAAVCVWTLYKRLYWHACLRMLSAQLSVTCISCLICRCGNKAGEQCEADAWQDHIPGLQQLPRDAGQDMHH